MTKLFTSALALLIATSTFENFTLADDDIEESINCIDLTPFVDDHHDMSVLAGGGSVPDDGPAIFHIPSTFISGEMVYCLENIPIPDMVGSNKCQDSDQCWLAVGLLADDESDQDDRAINSCKDSVTGDTGNCYNCACTGTSMSTGSLSRLQRNACGLSSDSSWGVSCTEANNGRIDWINDKPNPSNVSTVHVSVCAGSQSTCYVCAGGLHPSFKVRKKERKKRENNLTGQSRLTRRVLFLTVYFIHFPFFCRIYIKMQKNNLLYLYYT